MLEVFNLLDSQGHDVDRNVFRLFLVHSQTVRENYNNVISFLSGY